MEFKETIQLLSNRIIELKDNVITKEGTKNAFILPLIQSLGYNIFNPLEVIPDYSSDRTIATDEKKEKIEYAIVKEKKPIILIKCEHWENDLQAKDDTLVTEFNKSDSRFGMRTNGRVIKVYTDLAESGKMDKEPFLDIDLLAMKDDQFDELKKFHKVEFDIDRILYSANNKFIIELKNAVQKELDDPSPDFVKILIKSVYEGTVTKKIQDQFTPLVKRSISEYLSSSTRVETENITYQKDNNISTKTTETSTMDIPEILMEEDTTIASISTSPPARGEIVEGQYRHRRYRRHLH